MTRKAQKERLAACAIKRDGVVESRGFKEHWKIRAALGDNPSHVSKPGDEEGFLTDKGRFVSRVEAREIGINSGQCHEGGGRLLSSEIDW